MAPYPQSSISALGTCPSYWLEVEVHLHLYQPPEQGHRAMRCYKYMIMRDMT